MSSERQDALRRAVIATHLPRNPFGTMEEMERWITREFPDCDAHVDDFAGTAPGIVSIRIWVRHPWWRQWSRLFQLRREDEIRRVMRDALARYGAVINRYFVNVEPEQLR